MVETAAADPEPLKPADWTTLSDEKLLEVRMSDLGLAIAGTEIEPRIAEINAELDARGIRFHPFYYLSDEWFTPDGVPGIAIPFYLAHPRLAKLELKEMLEVEGGDHETCLKILRHEVGHAIDNAYDLRRRPTRRKLFGDPRTEYPAYYTPKPYSKSFVQHLDHWYAQSHPDEDFAETFAVWLTPQSNWEQRYAGWPALKKLEYMDSLMRSLAGRPPLVASAEEVDPLRRVRRTLRQHYRRRRRHHGVDHPAFYDRDLRRLFSDAPEHGDRLTAVQFIARHRRGVRRLVADWTGIYQYTIDKVLEDMMARCRELRLRLALPEDQARQEFTVLLTVQVMNYLHSGGHRVAL